MPFCSRGTTQELPVYQEVLHVVGFRNIGDPSIYLSTSLHSGASVVCSINFNMQAAAVNCTRLSRLVSEASSKLSWQADNEIL